MTPSWPSIWHFFAAGGGLRLARGQFGGGRGLQREERGDGDRQSERKLHATSAFYSEAKLRLGAPSGNPKLSWIDARTLGCDSRLAKPSLKEEERKFPQRRTP